MASKGDGIDLLSDAPPMGFLANLLCNMAGIDLGENPAVEEFRATILGFYVRTDDGEEFYIQAVRCGHVLEFVPNLSSKSFRDSLGLTKTVLAKILERTYQEFDSPEIELVEPPGIQVRGDQALVHAKLRVSAVYRGRRNFLLGDEHGPNAVSLTLSRLPEGWKLSGIEGLRPLGFDEEFLQILAAQVGLRLSRAEEEQRQRVCMPCRQRMAERFGPAP